MNNMEPKGKRSPNRQSATYEDGAPTHPPVAGHNYRREAAGTFPSRVRIGERSVAWYKSDIDDFVAVGGHYRQEEFN